MDISAMSPICQGNPGGVNYDAPYPVAEGVRDYFSQDVERAVDVGIEATPVGSLKQSTLDPLASVDLPLAYWLQVEEAARCCVALFTHNDADADQLRRVAKHLDEPCVRHEDEVLVGLLTQPDGLCPAVVLA